MSSDNNYFHDLLPGLIYLVIWFIYVIIWFMFYSFSSSSTEKWSKPFYYNCDQKSHKCVHIVRLIFEARPHQDLNKCSISLTLLAENEQVLVNMVIGGDRFSTATQLNENEPLKNIVRFLFFSIHSFENMETVVLNPKSNDYIKVYSVEFQDIHDERSEANVAQVGQQIKKMSPTQASANQSYPIMAKRFRAMEESTHPSRLLTWNDDIIFVWMANNLIGCFSAFILVCNGEELFCNEFNYQWLSSVYTGLFASMLTSLVFGVSIGVYRYLIKYKLEKSYGSGGWKTIQYIYLIIIVSIGISSAVVASWQVPQHVHSNVEHDLKPDLSIYWLSSICIGMAAFTIFWTPILCLLGLFFRFFEKSEAADESNMADTPASPQKLPQKKQNIPEKTELEAESDNYFQQLMKGGPKVKSISQYKGTAAKQSPQKLSTDDGSVGDTYMNQLAKDQGNVTSVSKYGQKKK